jgi:hypothetical protein
VPHRSTQARRSKRPQIPQHHHRLEETGFARAIGPENHVGRGGKVELVLSNIAEITDRQVDQSHDEFTVVLVWQLIGRSCVRL